jgi:hypothetical protein
MNSPRPEKNRSIRVQHGNAQTIDQQRCRIPILPDFARSPEECMVVATRVGSIKKYFRYLPDLRVAGRTRHLLMDLW